MSSNTAYPTNQDVNSHSNQNATANGFYPYTRHFEPDTQLTGSDTPSPTISNASVAYYANGSSDRAAVEEETLQDAIETAQLALQAKAHRSAVPVYNTKIRHGFAQYCESEQYMQMLAEVGFYCC